MNIVLCNTFNSARDEALFAHFCADVISHVIELALPKKIPVMENMPLDHTPTPKALLEVPYKLNVFSPSFL